MKYKNKCLERSQQRKRAHSGEPKPNTGAARAPDPPDSIVLTAEHT